MRCRPLSRSKGVVVFVPLLALVITGCAGDLRQSSTATELSPANHSASAVAASPIEKPPVTLVGEVSVHGVGLRDLDKDAVVYINGEWLGASDSGAYLSHDLDEEGGRVVFEAVPGDQVEFKIKNINITSISCAVKNSNGVILATDSAGEMEERNGKMDIEEANCKLVAPRE